MSGELHVPAALPLIHFAEDLLITAGRQHPLEKKEAELS
jgi:hypothetical protein